MVVRLKDINSDSTPSTKKGVVRLSDLTSSDNFSTSRRPINGPVEMDDVMGTMTKDVRLANEYEEKKQAAREIPVLKQIFTGGTIPFTDIRVGGLDQLGEFIESNPVTHFVTQTGRDILSSGPAGAISGLEGAAANVLGKYTPSLLVGSTIGKKATGIAAREALTGAPLGAAQTQASNPEASIVDVLEGAAIGAGGGAALGGLGAAAVKGLTRLADIQANKLAGNAISKATELPSRTVESPFTKGSPTNPVAQGYTENVGRTFGNRSVVRLSDLTEHTVTPRVLSEFDDIKPMSYNPSTVPTATTEPRQQGIRANYGTQLDEGSFSPELQSAIRNTDQRYDVQTNRASLDTANERLKDLPKAESDFLLNQSGGAEHTATGYRLMQELDALGEHERALLVSRKLADDLTKQGQGTQAARVLERLSPEGQLLNLVRTAEKNGKTVSVEDSVKFKKLAAEVQDNSGAGIRSNQFNEILDRVERGEQVSPNDMINLANFLSRAEKVVKPKTPIVRPPVVRQPRAPKVASEDDLPRELKQPKKRDKVISFFDDAEQAALARIAARKNNLNSLPLPEWRDHAIVVASQIAKGTIKAATHVEDLVRLFGEEIRPVAAQVYQSAQSMLKGVSRSAAEDKLERAQQALHRLSGKAEEEKQAVSIMGEHVKKLIADAKAGQLTPEGVQKLRDYADEITEMLANKKPPNVPTNEEKFLQSVKQLAKKIKEVETEKIEPEQANREISNLIRQVTKITEGETPRIKPDPALNKAISDIAHDVMNETRPTPKPTTLQEKIVEKFLKQKEKDGQTVSQADIDKLRQLAKDVTRLSSDQKIEADIAMQKILNSYEKSSPWDKVNAIRYIAMLLNSGTQSVNAISGPLMASTGYLADILGTMIKPSSTTLYGSSPLRFMAGYLKNARVGVKAGFHGVNPAGIQGTNEIRGLTYKGKYNPLSWLERGLGAVAKGADYATYKTVFDSEMVKQGYLDARKQGIKGRENIKRHVEQFVNDPPEAALEQADRIGKNTTFQRSDTFGGKSANWLNSAPKGLKPAVQTIFPFVRTPINIAETALDLTPAGLIKGLYQLTSKSPASQREAIRTLSLGLSGSAGLGSLGYYLNSIGIITGANDSGDKDVDSIREQSGKGKYRLNTSAVQRYLSAMLDGEGIESAEKSAQYQKGDKQIDYNKFQPLAFPLAAGASLSENKGKSALSRTGSVLSDSAGSLLGMSSLRGLQDTFQPQYGGTQGEKTTGIMTRLGESFFKSFSPSALAQEARRQDPIARKVSNNGNPVQDVTEYFKSRTPSLGGLIPDKYTSKSLPPNKTTLGISKQNAPGIIGQYVNPYKSEVAQYTEAAKFISDLIDRTGDTSLAPSAPDKKVTGKDKQGKPVNVAIPPDRYTQLQEEVGNEIIKKVMSLPALLSDARKAEKLKEIYTDTKEKYRTKVKRELGVH